MKVTGIVRDEELKVPQLFRHECGKFYILHNTIDGLFSLCCLSTGLPFSHSTKEIYEVFFAEEDHFERVTKVTIEED